MPALEIGRCVGSWPLSGDSRRSSRQAPPPPQGMTDTPTDQQTLVIHSVCMVVHAECAYLEPSVDIGDPPAALAAVPVLHELKRRGAGPGGREGGEGGGRLVGEGIQLGEDTCNTHTHLLM